MSACVRVFVRVYVCVFVFLRVCMRVVHLSKQLPEELHPLLLLHAP